MAKPQVCGQCTTRPAVTCYLPEPRRYNYMHSYTLWPVYQFTAIY